jgi:hypothetical protein
MKNMNKKKQDSERPEKHEAIAEVREHALDEGLEFFHDRWHEAWVTVPVKDHRETWRVESPELRGWVEHAFYKKFGGAVPKPWIKDTVEKFRVVALYEGEQREIHVRSAEEDGALFVDLADDAWRAVQVSSTGWRVIEKPGIKFRRSLGMAPLPDPQPGGSLRDLFRFLNVRQEHEALLLAWLTYCVRPSVPYPILAFSGVQGAGKTTASRILRALIDPSIAEITMQPRSERDLVMAASNSRVLAFDNLSSIDAAFSDTLCRVATGGAHRERKYFTNDGSERLFTYRNPVVVNGIEDLPQRPDLLDRTILVHLDPISESRRRDEVDLKEEFAKAYPKLFGAVLDAVAVGLARVGDVRLSSLPRMAGFAKWGVAIEKHLEFKEATFLRAYEKNREESVSTAIEASPIAAMLHGYLGHEADGLFHGTASELLKALHDRAQATDQLALKNPRWPKSPSHLSAEIARMEPALAKLHICVERSRRTTTRLLTLTLADGDDGDGGEDGSVISQSVELAQDMTT